MPFVSLRFKRIYNRFNWLKLVFKRKISCKHSFITSAKPPLPSAVSAKKQSVLFAATNPTVVRLSTMHTTVGLRFLYR